MLMCEFNVSVAMLRQCSQCDELVSEPFKQFHEVVFFCCTVIYDPEESVILIHFLVGQNVAARKKSRNGLCGLWSFGIQFKDINDKRCSGHPDAMHSNADPQRTITTSEIVCSMWNREDNGTVD